MTRWLVVGGGSAGCVVASRLSEDESNEVTLVEAGPDHGADPVAGDVGPFVTDPARLWPDRRVVRRPDREPESYAQGFGFGGSSLVNAAVVVPDPAHPDVDTLIPAEIPSVAGAVGEALLRAAPDAHPVSLARRGGLRVTAADAYLRPVMPQGNLTLETGRRIERLLLDGRRVRGAVAADGREYLADRVVVSAGAIGTPTILLRTGVDTPGVGVGAQDHPACSLALELEPGAVDSSAPSITAAIDRPGRQIVAMNHLPDRPGHGALLAGLMVVRSEGRVVLPDPAGPPVVELNQLDDQADVDGLVEAAMEALALLDHPAMRRVVRAAFLDDAGTPTSELAFDTERVRAWLPHHLTGFHHIAATCRMGVVTDVTGAVNGYEGLFVCDASLFEGVPTVNPYLPVVALAERLVARWRNER